MHWVVLGQTESGKTTLVKRLGSQLREQGHEVLALNPTGEPGYTRRDQYGEAGAEWETADPDAFVREVRRRCTAKSRRRFLLVDEAYELFTRDAVNTWIARTGRHLGLTVIAATQAAQMIDPRARGQFAGLYIFRCSRLDADFAANQWGTREVIATASPTFPTGAYFRAGGGRLTKGRLFG